MRGKITVLLTLSITLSCCINADKKRISNIISYWKNREIIFPTKNYFTLMGEDTIPYQWKDASYKIISYIDSSGCTSCKLRLPFWKSYIAELDSLFDNQIAVLLFLHPKTKAEACLLLKRDHFDSPVCLDIKDSLNTLNHFPSNANFQTFLLDKDNKILAIGNPILNPKVKDLYLRIIRGKPLNMAETDKTPQTTVSIPSTEISMGDFPWQEEQTAVFTLKNTGDKPLVIQDAVTSCGCLHVSFTQQPVLPGNEAEVHATYKADNPGYFNKSITVYTNAGDAPMKLRVRGNAVR